MRFDENFNVSLSLNPKREMIKVMKKYSDEEFAELMTKIEGALK